MIEINDKMLLDAINEVAATDAGKIVFAAIKDLCKWDATYLASDNPNTTAFYAAQRGVYGGLRKIIRVEYLKHIEYNYIRKPDDNRTHTNPPLLPSDRRTAGARTNKTRAK